MIPDNPETNATICPLSRRFYNLEPQLRRHYSKCALGEDTLGVACQKGFA